MSDASALPLQLRKMLPTTTIVPYDTIGEDIFTILHALNS